MDFWKDTDTKIASIVMGGMIVMVSIVMYAMVVVVRLE